MRQVRTKQINEDITHNYSLSGCHSIVLGNVRQI